VVLVEALEAVVEVDWRFECSSEGKGDSAGRGMGVVVVAFAGNAGVVVAQVDLLGVSRSLDEDEADGDAEDACVGRRVLRMM
jgi:hypothetical protein